MPLEVIAAVLLGAFLHASWNAIVKSAPDAFLDTVLITAGAAALGAIALVLLPAPLPASWPFLAASGAIHVLYFGLVAAAYRAGDLSQAYPLMRGSAPLIVAIASPLVLGEFPPPAIWAGIVLICAGIVGLALPRSPRRFSPPAVVAVAVIIAAYTFVDGIGVRRSGQPITYTAWVFVLAAIPLVIGWSRRAIGARAQLLRRWYVAPVGGFCTAGSYVIALWAMTRAPIAAVAALRETSILFGMALASAVLKERFGIGRIAAATSIALGAALLRLA